VARLRRDFAKRLMEIPGFSPESFIFFEFNNIKSQSMLNFKKIPANDKENKNLIVYNILRDKGQISRSDIANITEINVVSISNYINAFIKKGLILEKEVGESSGGRPPIILELNKDKVYAIGIYLFNSYIIGILLNSVLDIKSKLKKKLETKDNKTLSDSILNMINNLSDNIDKIYIKGVAIISDYDYQPVYTEEKITAFFSNNEDIRIYNERASISSAYAESIYIKNYSAKEKILYSHKDIGDCTLIENMDIRTWGEEENKKLNYFKPWNDSMSLRYHAGNIINKGVGTEIINIIGNSSIENIREEDIINAAIKKDNVAIEILEFVGLNLGLRLAYLVNIFKPTKLILGGGVEKAGIYFIEPIKRSIELLSIRESLRGLEIKNSILGEDAAALGAAALVIREIFMGV